MANINVNTTELKSLLGIFPADQNIMLVGKHGIGKSEILSEYFTAKGMKVVALFLGQISDPGDLIGLPTKNEKTGKTDFMPPYWFPLDGKPIVLFLDELNRARPEILQTIMDLALNRKLAGRSLPEGSRIISAVNAGDQYQLTDLDPALVSRFNIVNFRPTVQEWLLWAKQNDLDERVISFIEQHHIWLDRDPESKEGEDTGLDKTPDRRAWKRVSDIIKGATNLDALYTRAISSAVGPKPPQPSSRAPERKRSCPEGAFSSSSPTSRRSSRDMSSTNFRPSMTECSATLKSRSPSTARKRT
ncbi:MAG: AAA family ATPase [Bacteroidales bacterium]|nr:AAA family ATPase [Bacteroidales bacterium]